MPYYRTTTIYAMTWVTEWQELLHKKAKDTSYKQPPNFRVDIHDAIRDYCMKHDIVYFPRLYDDYMVWNAHYGHLYRTTDTDLYYFALQSRLVVKQINERESIRKLEQYAKHEHIQFHDNNVLDKIRITRQYINLHQVAQEL
jgi:hypothetical protein